MAERLCVLHMSESGGCTYILKEAMSFFSFYFFFPIVSLMLKMFSKQPSKVSTLFVNLVSVFAGLQEKMNGNE